MKSKFIILGSFFCAILTTLQVQAQTIIPPSHPDIPVFNTGPIYASFINSDLITISSGGTLKAFFVSGIAPANGVKIEDDAGGSAFLNITGNATDVVLADDLSAPGVDYIVGVTYVGANGVSFFDTYKISGVGSGFLSTTPLATSNPLNTSFASSSITSPHIDMFPDPNVLINGLPSMSRFIINWVEFNAGANTYSLMGAYGDMSNPTVLSPVTIATGATYFLADVAASFNIAGGIPYGYFAISNFNTGSIELAKMDCNTNTVVSSTTIAPLATTPRIEAMGLYDPSASNNPWTIATVATNTFGNSAVIVFSPNNPGGINCSSLFGNDLYLVANVAAGIGSPFGGGFGNENYTIAWYSPFHRMYVTRVIDYKSGTISTSYPDYYQVNSQLLPPPPYPGYAPKLFFDISCSSNSGEKLLPAWVDNGNHIAFYKLVNDPLSFKPTSVQETPKLSSLLLFPNPAHGQITLKGVNNRAETKYSIVDLSGRMVASGKLKEANTIIDIRNFSPGIYTLIAAIASKNVRSFQFVKK